MHYGEGDPRCGRAPVGRPIGSGVGQLLRTPLFGENVHVWDHGRKVLIRVTDINIAEVMALLESREREGHIQCLTGRNTFLKVSTPQAKNIRVVRRRWIDRDDIESTQEIKIHVNAVQTNGLRM